MFERFTERARNVVVVAQDEARALRHNFIGTEHILLGLLCQQDGLAAHVLTTLGIGVEAMRAQVARIVGTGDEPTSGQIPFTPRAKNVLERALEEALALGHNYVGSEHILLGLVREKNGVGARILRDSGLRADTIRDEVIRSLSTATPRRASVGGFAPAFALADLAAAIEDAKRSLIEKQAFDEAAELRDQQRRLHEIVREIEASLSRLIDAHALPLRRSERWTWEYDVRALAGKSGEGAQQLRTWRSEGWELLSIVEEDGGHRAVLERRGSA